jgi:hypothetical protein
MHRSIPSGQSREEQPKSKRGRECDAQNFDVPPLPNGELVLLLLPNTLPPALLLEPPKMLVPVFVLEPKPEDAEGKLDMLELRGATLAHRRTADTVLEGARSLLERK